MSDLVKRKVQQGVELAKEDVGAVAQLGKEAVKSAAYLYPFYGILYFVQHPRLVESLKPLIVRSLAISMVTSTLSPSPFLPALFLPFLRLFSLPSSLLSPVTSSLTPHLHPVAGMFTFTYLPQVGVLAFISGPLAFFAAIPLVLAESYFVILFLMRTFITPTVSEKIFDAVLLQKGHDDLVARGRAINKGNGGVQLGKSLLSPVTSKFSTAGLVRYLITLPLNLIPGVGTAVFLLLNGRKAGPAAHSRYFQLKQFDKKTRQQFVEQRSAAYTSFGASSILLGLIPLFGPATAFTSAAGAALWAADIEKSQTGGGKGTPVQELRKEVDVGHVEL